MRHGTDRSDFEGFLSRFIKRVSLRWPIVGTVKARQMMTPAGWSLPLRDPKSWWCDVQPEKESEALLENVPMPFRVMNYGDDLGFIYIPKMETQVYVFWLGDRPTIISAQEWDGWILKKDDSNYITWDYATNNFEMKTSGTIRIETPLTSLEKVGLSKQIDCRSIILGPLGAYHMLLGELVRASFNSHFHSISTPVPGSPTTPPVVPMPPAVLSKINKLD